MTGEWNSLLDRRNFMARIGTAGAALTVLLGGTESCSIPKEEGWGQNFPDLPYDENALAPHISQNTISFHYGKHHRAYVDKTIKMTAGTDLEGASLEAIIRETAGKTDKAALFNNAAQAFNHRFFWNSMKPGGGGEPSGIIAEKIQNSFDSYSRFVEEFTNAAATQFGSGWAWLVKDGDALNVVQTANADTPIAHGMNPLLTIDVWEHAYYLDYQNRRSDFIKAYVDSLMNWDFAEQNHA